jgi:nucleotide-binding universal stress UspA family protein
MKVRRILLPLDGSDLAEIAIPPALYFAKSFDASLLLLHVVELSAPRKIHGGAHHIADESEAVEYLHHIAETKIPKDVHAEIHVHSSAVRDVAKSIAEHGKECDVDAVLMCAHGKGNPLQWFAGNNAQKIISRCETPVFFFPATYLPRNHPFTVQSILLPEDFQPTHGRGTEWAEFMAQRCHIPLNLVSIVPTAEDLAGEQGATRTMLPRSTKEFLDIEAEHTKVLLTEQVNRLETLGVSATMQIIRGDPATQIVSQSGANPESLLVVGTHGRVGNEAFWNRSVAARILPRISNPALLVPVR